MAAKNKSRKKTEQSFQRRQGIRFSVEKSAKYVCGPVLNDRSTVNPPTQYLTDFCAELHVLKTLIRHSVYYDILEFSECA